MPAIGSLRRPHGRLAQLDQEPIPRQRDVEPELADAGAVVQAGGKVAGVAEAGVGRLEGRGVGNLGEVEGFLGGVVGAGGEEEAGD